MPGRIVAADHQHIAGWAWHSGFHAYPVVVHLAARSTIVASVVADQAASKGLPAEANGHAFRLPLSQISLGSARLEEVCLLIGETDEYVSPFTSPNHGQGTLTIEEIISAPRRRPWVTGKIYFDAELAGLSCETIVDLFYRDYLGRPADTDGLAHYTKAIRQGKMNYVGLRKGLIESEEYRGRRRHVQDAPGAIFSQKLVLTSPEADDDGSLASRSWRPRVSVRQLLSHGDEQFVATAYRQILGLSADSEGLRFYLGELRKGRSRLDLLHQFSRETQAVVRGVHLVDIPAEVLDSRSDEQPTEDYGWALHGAPSGSDGITNIVTLPDQAEDLSGSLGTADARLAQSRPISRTPGNEPTGGMPPAARSDKTVFLGDLLAAADDKAFLAAAYLQVLGREIDLGGMGHFLYELYKGRPRVDIVRQLAATAEAVERGVRLVDNRTTSVDGAVPVESAPPEARR